MKKAKALLAMLLAVMTVLSCFATGFAANLDESEPNDSFATATVLTEADVAAGRLNSSDDVDWYCFNVETAGLVSVKFGHDDAKSHMIYFKVKAYDEQLTSETEFNVYGDETETYSAAFSAAPGKQYIAVSKGQVQDGTLAYTVSITINTDVLSEKEPNNTIDTATPLELSLYGEPKRYLGNLSNGDVDCFEFNVPKAGFIYYYLYNTNGTTGNYKAVLSSYVNGSDGSAVARTIGTLSIDKTTSSNRTESIGVKPGRYHITVSGSIGGYEIRVLFTESTVNYEQEFNGDFTNANTFAFSQKTLGQKVMVGSSFDKNDVDIYKFYVTSENLAANLEIKPDETSTDRTIRWKVRLYNSKNICIEESSFYNDKIASFDLTKLALDQYYLEIIPDQIYTDPGYYYITTSAHEYVEPTQQPGGIFGFFSQLWQKIKDIGWTAFWDQIKEIMSKIDFVPLIQSMVTSIKNVIGILKAQG